MPVLFSDKFPQFNDAIHCLLGKHYPSWCYKWDISLEKTDHVLKKKLLWLIKYNLLCAGIWGSLVCGYEECGILGCNTV
jgi:hypothetical protein